MSKTKLEFAKYTDITTFAKELSSEYNQYEKVLICPDVNTSWVARILLGFDDDYNVCEDAVLIESNNLDKFGVKHNKHFKSWTNIAYAKAILEADLETGLENYEIIECDDMDEAFKKLSDISGIIQEDGSLKFMQ